MTTDPALPPEPGSVPDPSHGFEDPNVLTTTTSPTYDQEDGDREEAEAEEDNSDG